MSIQRKLKVCKGCRQDKYIFGNGLCKSCYGKSRPIKKYTNPIGKEFSSIKKQSKKQTARNITYMKLRDRYLSLHSICERCKVKKSEEIHHKRGRDGQNLFKDFLAVCRECHDWIENNPIEAKQQGFTLTRLSNKKNDSE